MIGTGPRDGPLRLGAIWVRCSNANYRALDPLRAMARRGHHVTLPDPEGSGDLRRLAGSDVLHIYRRADDHTRRLASELRRSGVAITFDEDDDLTAVPKESPDYKKVGGLAGQRLFARSVKLARSAQAFTTTRDLLAAKYQSEGVNRIEVIPNCVADAERPGRPHEGLVIGWIAGIDHRADVVRIPIERALRRLTEQYEHVRVESVGVKLRLEERYRHEPFVPFEELPDRIAGFDIGIAPLADIPANRVRSDIKLKEYAATGIPWLASPIGPYVGLGEQEGGRLVADDDWFESLEALVLSHSERQRLADNARRWARAHTIDAVAERWEAVFMEAAGRAAGALSATGAVGSRPSIRVGIGALIRRA